MGLGSRLTRLAVQSSNTRGKQDKCLIVPSSVRLNNMQHNGDCYAAAGITCLGGAHFQSTASKLG